MKEREEGQTKKTTSDSAEAIEGKKTLSPTRDTSEIVKYFLTKEMMEIDELELLQGPFNFDSLSLIQIMKIASFAQAKAKEKLLKSHMEDYELLKIASNVLEKIMPSFQKDSSASSSGNLKSLVSYVSTHFESLEKSAKEKVRKEFMDKRFTEL